MPKKRRQAHVPQQPARNKRRVTRRPGFAAAPEPEERVDLDGNPIFAEGVSVPDATAHWGTAGPVETRPHWIGATGQQSGRQPGRRMAQLRGEAPLERATRVSAGQLPTFAPGYLSEELRRIAITSAVLFAAIIVLALIMR